MGVQAFRPEPPVERFDVGNIDRLAGPRDVKRHAASVRPQAEIPADELRAAAPPRSEPSSRRGRCSLDPPGSGEVMPAFQAHCGCARGRAWAEGGGRLLMTWLQAVGLGRAGQAGLLTD